MYYSPSMAAELSRREVLELAKHGATLGIMGGMLDVAANDDAVARGEIPPRKTNPLGTMVRISLYSLFGAGAMIAGGNTLAEIRKREEGKAEVPTDRQEATTVGEP